jgi:hypothetical protein
MRFVGATGWSPVGFEVAIAGMPAFLEALVREIVRIYRTASRSPLHSEGARQDVVLPRIQRVPLEGRLI